MYEVMDEAPAVEIRELNVQASCASAPKTFHERDLELAKKGFRDPDSLSNDDIRQLCGVMIFYSNRLANLP